MKSKKSINIIIRKMQIGGQHQSIVLTVQSSSETHMVSSPRPVKNGTVNFYGQRFQLLLKTQQLCFIIHNAPQKQQIVSFIISKQTVSEFGFRKKVFVSEVSNFKINWEAYIESEDRKEEQTDRDFEETDDKADNDNNNLKPAQTIRKKRRLSFKQTKNEDAISEPSQPPNKFTLITNDTAIKLRRKASLMQTITEVNLKNQRVNISLPLDKLNVSNESKRLNNTSFAQHRRLAQKTKNQVFSPRVGNLSSRPMIQRKMSQKRSGLIKKFRMRSVIISGIIGMIAGLLTASQI